jgi:stage V sporulation protein R
MSNLLYTDSDWTFARIDAVYEAIREIAIGELGLDVYRNQIEVITSEQMLDAYSSHGMPLMYRHWSFGKHFARDEFFYKKGMQGLAYEIVINSDPCISYVMEENTMTMQTLVIAHACFGHNHFFKNNYLFREWTDAAGILDYLHFAQAFVAKCEEKYGTREVERVLDAAHALMNNGVNRYERKSAPNLKREEEREKERREHAEKTFNDLWRTVPMTVKKSKRDAEISKRKAMLGLPEENLLYFLEKKAPNLKDWQRELVRIVRQISQYFYPQRQTKLMNEGCATYVHYKILTRMHEKGQISDGNFMEFLHSHTNVVHQPTFEKKYYSGINPYALGFAMMSDIERICTDPTAEDREWMPDIAGNGDPMGTLRHIWANYRDESFVLQYLSPKVIRDFRLFSVEDDETKQEMYVDSIHNETGYRKVRHDLAMRYDPAQTMEDIQVTDVDLLGDRKLVLTHFKRDGRRLETPSAIDTCRHLANLWGYAVELRDQDESGSKTLFTTDADGGSRGVHSDDDAEF